MEKLEDVLLISSEGSDIVTAQQACSYGGYELHNVTDYDEAMTVLNGANPDYHSADGYLAIVLALDISDGSGERIAHELEKQNLGHKIAVMDAVGRKAVGAQQQYGFVHSIRKPFMPLEFQNFIESRQESVNSNK